MHPVLFHIGTFPVGTYGVLVALAAITALLWLRRLARQAGRDPEPLTDLVVGCIIAALLGAKLLLLITDWPAFVAAPLEWAKNNLRAFGVYYGGFITGVLWLGWSCRRRNIDFWTTVDLMAPPVALGHAIGRWGCFAAGCCYGHPTGVPWAVVFRDPDSLAEKMLNIPVHPVQLYESAGNFLLAALLAAGLRRKWPAGRVFILYLCLYGASRFIYEFFRGDADRGLLFNGLLSTSQLIAIFAVAAAAGLFVWRRRAAAAG